MRRYEDDRQLSISCGKIALKLKSASSRHPNVKDEASRAIGRAGTQKFGNGRKLLGMEAYRPQQTSNGVAKLGVVVDDRDAGVRVSHHLALP
jgi:hypothetical protein